MRGLGVGEGDGVAVAVSVVVGSSGLGDAVAVGGCGVASAVAVAVSVTCSMRGVAVVVGGEPGAGASATAPESSDVSPAPARSEAAVLSWSRDREVFLSPISDARKKPKTPAVIDNSTRAPTSHQRYRGRRGADAASSSSPPHRMQKRPVSCPFAPHLGHITTNLQGTQWDHPHGYNSTGFEHRKAGETPSPANAAALLPRSTVEE